MQQITWTTLIFFSAFVWDQWNRFEKSPTANYIQDLVWGDIRVKLKVELMGIPILFRACQNLLELHSASSLPAHQEIPQKTDLLLTNKLRSPVLGWQLFLSKYNFIRLRLVACWVSFGAKQLHSSMNYHSVCNIGVLRMHTFHSNAQF